MLRAITRKAFADLRGRPLQVALLFAVIAAAAFTLSLALNVQGSAARPADRLRDESNGADLWISTITPQGDAEVLKSLPSVAEVSGPYPVSWTNYGINNAGKKQQFALIGMPEQLPAFDHPVVTDGRWLSAGGAGEIVVDRGAARLLKLRVGQNVEILTPGGPQTFTVVGFAVPTGRAPAPINDPAFAYVLPQALSRLEPNAVFGASPQFPLRTGVRLRDPNALPAFFQQARVLGPFDIRTWTDIRQNITESNQFDVIFLNVFSFFALVAAGLIIANAVGGQVLSQLRDTGILKAIGFTPRQITLSLLVQNLAVSLLAGVVGIALGLLVAPFFLERSADILGVPASPALNPALLAITFAAITALVALFTLFPAWRAGRVGAIAALNAGSDSGPGRPSRLASIASRLGLPRVFVVGVKDLARRPVRTLMTVAALVLAVVTATFSLGIESTFKATMSDATVIGGPPYQVGADRDLMPDAEARRLLESRPEVESYLVVYNTDGAVNGQGFDLRGFEGDMNNPRWAMREGRMPVAAGEAAMSTQLATKVGLRVGDTFNFNLFEPGARIPATVRIVGLYADAEGEVLTVPRSMLPPEAKPTDYFIHTRPGTDNRAFARSLSAASGGNLDLEVLTETIAGIRNQWRPVIFGLNGVLFLIAGLNLLSSMLLSIRERHRDFAVLKTIGFTPAQVTQTVFAGSAVLAIVAVAVGLPAGLVATRVMFDVLSSAAGIGTGIGKMPGALWLAPLIPGAILVAALGTIIPARRAASVHIAESLRYE